MTVSAFLPILIVPLIGWRLYRRFHRLTRRQPVSAVRSWLTLLLCPLALGMLALACRADAAALAALLAGSVAGAILGIYSQRLTHYEFDRAQLYYMHNIWIGAGLFSLVLVRLGYRLFQLYALGGDWRQFAGPGANAAMMHSALTMALLGLLLAYYARYAAGILIRRRQLASAPAEAETPLA